MTLYKFAVGAVLTVAMVGVLGVSALVFSSRDFQFGVQQVSPSTNGLVDFRRLAEADAQIQALESETAAPRGELLEVEQQIASIDAQTQGASAAADAARAEIVGGIAQVESSANINNGASAAADMSAQALSQRVNTLASRPGLSATDQQNVAALSAQVNQLATQEEGLDQSGADRAALSARQRALSGQVAESNRRIFALQQSVVPDYEQFGRIRSEAQSLAAMSPLGVSAYLAQGHPALLSTILVLLMGALGSLLYLFPAYLNRPAPVTMAEIVVRLIFGMCAALAFYVLANAAIAGFSIASSVTQATTSSTLNPFTVSLVGIVAGVLSEDIAKWIQDRGRGIFTQGQISTGAPGAAQAPVVTDPNAGGGLVNNQAIS
jgi:vacuolar-type H+-ATPase subunit D/Vma8